MTNYGHSESEHSCTLSKTFRTNVAENGSARLTSRQISKINSNQT